MRKHIIHTDKKSSHILMLHRVLPSALISNIGMWRWEITTAMLEKFITSSLEMGYKFISLDELYNRLIRKEKLYNYICITFDDGYKDTLIWAYPILKKYQIPFAIYVVPAYLNASGIKWDYLIEHIVQDHEHIEIKVRSDHYILDCRTYDLKIKTAEILNTLLYSCNNKCDIHIIRNFIEKYVDSFSQITKELMLNWEDLNALSKDSLVLIGNHSQNHYNLSQLSRDDAKTEIVKSLDFLARNLDVKVCHLAYPYGSTKAAGFREYKLAKEAGFKTAVTTIPGPITNNYYKRLTSLPRQEMRLKVDGTYIRDDNTALDYFNNLLI